MIREVLQKGADILRTKCEQVTDFSAAQPIIDDLKDTIEQLKTTYEFTRGIGLAAPQIGEKVRITVAEFNNRVHVLINPEIIETSKEKKPIWEGCISFFEYRAHVPRYDYVKIKAVDSEGNEYTVEGHGDSAMLLQHELDHLDGILYVDHLPQGEKELVLSHKA